MTNNLEKCEKCSGDISTRVTLLDVRAMRNPPRQRERWVEVTRWQCIRVEKHNGEWRRARDD